MPKKYLFIAEKPSSMREFSGVYKKHTSEIDSLLGGTVDFTALRGHVFRNLTPKEYSKWDKKWVELYETELPMVPDTWQIGEIPDAKDTIDALKDKLKTGNYTGIIVGTDADVEGYGIFYLCYEALGLQNYEILRFYETALTEKDILQSFHDIQDLFGTPRHANAVNAYLFRSHWDWLIGMNFTTGYSVRYGEMLKIGSVKAPTLKMIYDNCAAIDGFTKTTTYGIKSVFTKGFEASLLNDNDRKDRIFPDKPSADKFAAGLAGTATVTSFTKTTNTVKAPKLYSLSDLQIDAAKAPYGYTPDQTLDIVQKLYEAKILTYPRTSGNYLASGKVKDLPGMIDAMKDVPDIKQYVLGIKQSDFQRVAADRNIINDAEVAKAAHDALVPTGEKFQWDKLSKSEQNILYLVGRRLVAHFLPYFTEEKVQILLDNSGSPFKADGRRTLDNGFNAIFNKTVKDVILPDVNKGDVLDIKETVAVEKVSEPPKRYSNGTIIKAMKSIASQISDPELKKVMKESEGIGTEATRAGILTELEKTGYIEVKKNLIYITPAGKRYIEYIRTQLGDGTYDYGIADPVKVAYWAAKAKDIQLGELQLDDAMREFLLYLGESVDKLKASGAPVKKGENSAYPACPLCGGILKDGKFGVYCSNYKEKGCRYSIPNELCSRQIPDAAKVALANGKKIKLSNMKSKKGSLFTATVYIDGEGKIKFEFNN